MKKAVSHYLRGDAYRRATAKRLALTNYARLRREAGLDPPLRFRFGGSFLGSDGRLSMDAVDEFYEGQEEPTRLGSKPSWERRVSM